MTDINAGSVRGEFKFDIAKAIADLQAAIKGVNELTTKTKEAEKEAEKEAQAVSEQGKKTEEAGKKAEEAGKKIDEAGKKTEGAGKKAEEAGKKEQEAGKKTEEAGKKTEEAGKKTEEAGRKTEDAGKKTEEAGKKVDEAGKKAETTGKRTKEAGEKSREAGQKMKQSGEDARKASLGTGLLSNELSRLKRMFTGLSAVMAVGATFRFASEIEQGFVGVKRTTGLIGEEFDELRGKILKLAGEIRGIDIGAMQNIAVIGGQLGIHAVPALEKFVEWVGKSSRAMNMSDEAAANYLARISNLMNHPIEDVEKLANVIADLANNTTATAEDLMNIMERMGGSANVFGLTIPQVTALAATMRDAGVNLEIAGTAWSQILTRMLRNAEGFAKVAGVSVQDFTNLMKNEPIKAVEALANGLAKLNKFGRAKALEDLSLQGVRVGEVLIKLSSNMDGFHKNLERANKEFEHGNTVQRSYEVAANTLSASLSQLWNSIKLLADTLAGWLLPLLSATANDISKTIQWLAGYRQSTDEASRSVRAQADEAENLRKAFDELASKTNRTSDEQKELNRVADALTKIFPQLTIEYNKNGDAIGYMADQYARFLTIKNKEAIDLQQKNLQDLEYRRLQLRERIGVYKQQNYGPDDIPAGVNPEQFFFRDLAEKNRTIAELQREEEKLNRDAQQSAEYLLYLRTGKLPPQPQRPSRKDDALLEGEDYLGEDDEKKKKEREPWFGYNYESQVNRELTAIQQAGLRRAEQEIELNRKRAASAAETADEKLLAEQQYYDALQRLQQKAHEAAMDNLATERREKLKELEKTEKALKPKDDPDYATKVKEIQAYRLQIEELHDKKILALKEDFSLKQQEITQNLADAQKRIREEAANEEKRILEKQQREYERMMRERERTFRRIFEPLFEGGNLADILKKALQEDLVDFMAHNFPASLPIADQKGGVFNLLMGGGEKIIGGGSTKSAKQPVITSDAVDYKSIAQQQTEVQEQIAANTKQTVVQAEKTNRGLMSLPINIGHIIGAVIGVGLSGGKLSFKSILTTFGLSLLGGFANAAITGLNAGVAPKVNEYGTIPMPKVDIGASDLPPVTGAKISTKKALWATPFPDIPTDNLPRSVPSAPIAPIIQITAPRMEMPSLTMPANADAAKAAPVNVNTTLNVNTGGAPFDRAAAQSLEKSIERKVTETVLRDFRRGGAIRRTQEAAL